MTKNDSALWRKPMKKREFRSILERHNLKQRELAELLDQDERTTRRHARGHVPIPAGSALVLRALDRGYVSLDQLRELASA